MRAPAIRAVGLLSGWGEGAASVPLDAKAAAAGRAVLEVERPALDPERFRRSRRECLMGVAAVHLMLEDAQQGPEAVAGERTALLFATTAAYAPSNRAFIESRGGSTYFPYTAAAAVPAEVAIAFGLTGPYEILIGGAPATLRAIARAAALLEAHACDHAIVLAVEVFAECADVFARVRRAPSVPLVETAACLCSIAATAPSSSNVAGAARAVTERGSGRCSRASPSPRSPSPARRAARGRWRWRGPGEARRRGSSGARAHTGRALAWPERRREG